MFGKIPRITRAIWNWMPEKSKKAVKRLGMVFLATLAIAGAITPFNHVFAVGFLWSFYHAETSTSWWTGHGLSAFKAINVANLFSFVSTLCWFYIIYGMYETFKKTLNSNNSSDDGEDSEHTLYYKIARKAPFVAVPLCSFGPNGGVFFSAYLSRILGLNMRTALALSLIGSVAKNIIFGFGFASRRFHYITWAFVAGLVAYTIFKAFRRPHKINHLLKILTEKP